MVDMFPYPHVLYVGGAPAVISTLLRAEAMTAGYGKMAILHDVTLDRDARRAGAR